MRFAAIHGIGRGPGQLCTAKNSCFGPRIKNDTIGNAYLFTNASVTQGIVDQYDQAFLNGTSIDDAKSQVLRWMPSDASFGPMTVVNGETGSCALVNITSPTLARVLGISAIGDPQGVVGVVFTNIDANLNYVYDPHNIQTASLSVAPVDGSNGC